MTVLLYYKITHFSIYLIKKQELNKNIFWFEADGCYYNPLTT